MDIASKIKDLAESRLSDDSHFVVDVLYLAKHRPPKVVVIVDGDKGVTIDACAGLSRELSTALDEMNWGDTPYLLEVSTPGLEHPLKLKRQYFKNVGRQFKLHLRNKSVVNGLLERATESGLTVDQEVREGNRTETRKIKIPFDEVEKAFVMVSFK